VPGLKSDARKSVPFSQGMKAKIIITGGSGLLAINWALAIRDNYSVILGLHQRSISLAGVETQHIDLDFVDNLVRTFEALEPQLVVHTTGYTNVEECEANPDLAQHINVELAGNVSLACMKLDLPLIHISTDHLFSTSESLVNESAPVTPNNVYGRTKAEAEVRVLETCPHSLVLRTNFYGWGPNYRHSFSDLIINSLRSNEELTLFTDVIYTPILIEAAIQAAHELFNMQASGIFHVVGDERISKYDFGLKIAEKFDLDPGLVIPGLLSEQTTLVQRPYDMSLSNQKACDILGRKLGGVDEHLTRLLQQEELGFAREVQKL